MAAVSDIIRKTVDVLKAESGLAEIKEWQEVNNLITLKSPGISVGLEKETFTAYDRKVDNAEANLKIYVWVKDSDPARGEAEVRTLSHIVRLALAKDLYLSGLVDSGFVSGIEYLTADAGKEILIHLAEIDYQVSYLAERTEYAPALDIGEIKIENDD
ncbi:hypothetical protein Sgly_0775 [Syntrophobotulus glycolicus DSM 8271]|uniref:Phage protein n=1 Tax=Syntrophobotulus glycolicus (strain DSM 8271 / FlGlyR) TaxID=645991 RepID=F0T168_SYNGF|nr:hypothetical protein [Syntrophobotulus glycolicus]ADY55132.1 hypothetical protein Sgly_0775 [Syntrophobotulus glycolicus DSM 8271]